MESGGETMFNSGISFPGKLVKVRFEKTEPRNSASDMHKQTGGGDRVQGAFCTLLFSILCTQTRISFI